MYYEATIGDGYLFDYRVYRSSWESSVFETNIDSLYFLQGIAGQADTKEFFLTISSVEPIKRIVLSDLQGKVLYDHVSTEDEISIGTAEFAAGVYILTVITTDLLPEKRLVIKK